MKWFPWLIVAAGPCLLAGQSASQGRAPLQRNYHDGEKLAYQMKGLNESWQYSIRADGVVKADASGKYTEEYMWSGMQSNGQPLPLSPSMSTFRQQLSLDPNQIPAAPDFTKIDPKLIGPISDFMTFYSDLWLANRIGQLNKAGDHFYFRNPMGPVSFADGTRVLIGQSAIDFDLTLKSVDTTAGTATLEVRHVPPEKSALELKAAWMQAPVGSLPNNWQQVTKTTNGYEVAVGQETFAVEITVSLADGKILSATMDNPVKAIQRTCEDEALTKCGPAQPHEIHRKIEIALLQ